MYQVKRTGESVNLRTDDHRYIPTFVSVVKIIRFVELVSCIAVQMIFSL